jgi:hypothetical protein
LAHLNPRTIAEMARDRLVDGIELPSGGYADFKCPHCVVGKMTHQPYSTESKEIDPTIEVADVIHTDQMDLHASPSRDGNKYVLMFVDEASRMGFVYALRCLEETIDRYRDFVEFIRTQKGKNIKVLVSDGHSTYMSKAMDQLLREHGTIQKVRSPYEPNQNPIPERRARTLAEMARTMMIHAGVETDLWEYSLRFANYIRNRVKTRVLPNVTPYEKFWGKKPDLSRIRPFGCLGYVFKHKNLRESKWDTTALPAILLGFADHHSAYCLEMIGSKEIKIARNVMFFEEVFPYRVSPSMELRWINPRD